MSEPFLSDLAAGLAAEHIVCADLLLAGHRAFLTDQNCPYDLAVEIHGRLVRVQVKATRCLRAVPQRAAYTPAYLWNVRRAGKGGARVYGADEFDMLALVALDIRHIAYMPAEQVTQTVHIRPPNARTGKQFSHYTFPIALQALGIEPCAIPIPSPTDPALWDTA